MAKVSLSQPVRVSATGETTTIAALLDAGRVKLVKVDHFGASGRVAYFADFEDGSGWEIGKTAYESRMGIKPDFRRKGPLSKEVNDFKGYTVTVKQLPDGRWSLSAIKKHGLGGFHQLGATRDAVVKPAIEFLSGPFA